MGWRFPAGLKRYTTPVIGRVPVWIMSGPNRGLRWSLAGWGSGYGSGNREASRMKMLSALIREGDVVWDVGAHYGYVTLLAARIVGSSGHVYSFEPSAGNRWFLERHVRWNALRNVTVLPVALGGFDGSADFGGGYTSKQHRIGGGSERIEVRSASSLLADGVCRPPSFLKVDVEGAEGDLLEAGCHSLEPSVRMVVAMHSWGVYTDCRRILGDGGFSVYETTKLARQGDGSWHGDPDLVAFGPEYPDTERDVEILKELGV